MEQAASHDIFVIGGGINGCGIARDAVGRGYSVSVSYTHLTLPTNREV